MSPCGSPKSRTRSLRRNNAFASALKSSYAWLAATAWLPMAPSAGRNKKIGSEGDHYAVGGNQCGPVDGPEAWSHVDEHSISVTLTQARPDHLPKRRRNAKRSVLGARIAR